MDLKKNNFLKKLLIAFLCVFVFYTFADEIFSAYKKQGLAYKSISKIYRIAKNYKLKKEFEKKKYTDIPTPEYLENRYLIAHAFGGIENHSYTNSLEAFKENYAVGHRIFEVDFAITRDGHLVACHDWEHFNNITGTYNVLSYSEFKSALIYGKYTPLGIEDIIELMKTYNDFYVVTDKLFPGTEKEMISKLLEACDNSEELLNRFVVQVYSDKNFLAIDKIYHFKNYIYTLYVRGNHDLEQNAQFCVVHGIPVVTMWSSWATNKTLNIYKSHNIKVFAHTVNEKTEQMQLSVGGVYGIYTDFIAPEIHN